MTLSTQEITIANQLGPQKVESFLQTLATLGRLDLQYSISACNGQVHTASNSSRSEHSPAPPTSPTVPEIRVELSGPDTPLLTDRNGELLHAIEHIAAKILRLEPEEHDRISFDAAGFKANRDQALRLSAQQAIDSVLATGKPYAFPPMNSRERRLLHLVLSASGLPTSSSGDNPRRFVVLYPLGHPVVPEPAAQRFPEAVSPDSHDRERSVRNSFRRR